jgi:DNA-binding transcriptional regulator YiaG
MTSTASLLSTGEILKQDSLGRVRTPLGKRQEILAAFDGSGMSAARFAAMVGINYSTFCSWVQERNQKQGKDSVLTGAAAKPQVQWIEAEIACGAKPRCAGDGMELELLGGGAMLRIRDERDARLAAVVLRAMGGGAC